MPPPAARSALAPLLAAALLAAPLPALAAGGVSVEGALLAFLAAAALGLAVWAAWFFSPLRHAAARRRGPFRAAVMWLLGGVALAFGVVALVTGQSSLGQGGTALRALEPQRFWLHVGLQLGTGCLLIVFGLLERRRGR